MANHANPAHPLRPGHAVDVVLYRSPDVRIGAFRCPAGHPDFQTAGPIEDYSVVFPRSSVWIQHEGRASFVADASVAVLYNRGQPYRRFPLSADGDRADWFSVSGRLARSVATRVRGGAADPARPFSAAFGPVPASLYYRQRMLFAGVAAGQLRDRAWIEQEVAELLYAILSLAQSGAVQGAGAAGQQRQVVERARATLAASPSARPTVRDVARSAGVSPFHLCRLFRRHTGHTLHHYQLELRARTALEMLESAGESLSRVAHGIGFSSHSHFTAAFRDRLGLTPSGVRRSLRQLATTPS